MGILGYLFLFTLVAFPFGQIFRLQLPWNINSTLFDATVILTGILYLILQVRKGRIKSYTLTSPILLFFLITIISLLVNFFRYPLPEIAVASLYALRWLLLACMYYVVRDLPKIIINKIPFFLTLVGSGVLVIGYIQYIFYSNLRNLYYLGWDDHLYRMFSSFLDPNFAGAFFCLYFFFLIGQLLRESFIVNKATIPYYVLSILTFIAIFLTSSRSAILMLAAGLITFLFIIGKKRYILVFFIIVSGIFLMSSQFFYLENINPFRRASSAARVESAQNALAIIANNSIFGVGFNAYRYAQYAYGYRTPDPEISSHADSGTDNSFLFVLATTGIIGFAVYVSLLFRIYKLARRNLTTPFGLTLLISLVGLCVSSLFVNSLFYPFLLYWLWVIAGLTDYT